MAAANPYDAWGVSEDNEDTGDYEDVDQSNSSSENTARTFQQARGIFEAEVNCVEEVNLHTDMDSCEKNPGHRGFIPADEFTVNSLPPHYRDNDIAKLIQALAQITARISIKYTSSNRPDFYPGSDKPYPNADMKGKTRLRTGSGWVWRVNIFSGGNNRRNKTKACPCQECKKSRNPERQWAVIDIYTATHMVYDEAEGAKTTCHFFYDNNRNSLAELPSLHGAVRVHNVVDGDACRMTYITHDIQLASKLQNSWREYKTLHTAVGEKYNTTDNDGQAVAENDHKLTIIVSHPHGCSKQISIGEFVQRDEMDYNDAYTKYTYTTPTCPGCSGGPVYVLSRWWWWGCDHPHGGQCEENENLNYSGIAMY
ncbi:unnamed protein product [Candidula unifasciata]|uniref:Uncharacterized protein n=1 Tax=Candidula unifasciata TaxID=100452 RepID=A0A8S3Z722_9EUPU|nr:unnamed protein product [Candidula unifasciata]